MIERRHPISTFIFLSIIFHGVLIFLLVSFLEKTFSKGSEPQSRIISVTLLGKEMEKTSSFFDSEDFITPIEKSEKPISGDLNISIGSIFPLYQKERYTEGKIPETQKEDYLQVMESSEVANHSRKGEVGGIGWEIGKQIAPIENDGTETPMEVNKKMGSNVKLEREVNQGTFIGKPISLLPNPVQKDDEASTFLEDEKILRDSLLLSGSFEKNLVPADWNLPEGVSEGSQWEKDPEWASYQMELFRLIEKGKRYPLFAKMRNMSGVVVVGFTIGSEGRASDIEVLRSSEQEILDREALDTIRRVSPFPPFPEGFRLPRMNLSISLKFDLKKS